MCFNKFMFKNYSRRQGAWLILFIGGAVVCLWLLYFTAQTKMASRPIYNFNDCLSAGYPKIESYPARCATPDGRIFIEKILSKHKPVLDVKVIQPTVNQLVFSPLAITGEARGSWFFEASFPVRLIDGNGYVLAERPA